MAWEHLAVNRPHLVYIILGGFTSLFMLCSSVIKERLYIGEATVATLCGIIFGPHAANLINPGDWGNTDQITLEFARIVLVVQCFAVGVELPKSYMEKHWKSVTLLLVPVMTFGWLITSLFVWWMFGAQLNWLDSLCVAACVTATDPVLASSVVGKGKFAKRVPKHLRDLLSAESGCNDGMAFPFIYLALYLIRYRPSVHEVALHWFCYTILYECVFGCIYGVTVGYVARRAIRAAHERDLIDRESFLVFYFVLALFCAGSGSILGVDDLLVGFACGVGFSNDGWFQEKTEESHVSNVIDLLINLAFFVYFGSIIPWEQYNSATLGITPWRLVVVGIMVLFFRRIPIMLALKPVIPDIKTWREALFAGHFGPIGVGAIFVAIMARAELETEGTTPLAVIPEPGFEHRNIIELIWPITTFLVIVSILIHGSSIAVFTLGRHINTLAISVSFTKANDDGPSWMDRLPRIQSRSKSSISFNRPNDTESSLDEKLEEGMMSPSAIPRGFLRRLKDEETPSRASSRRSSRRKKWDAGIGPGGPVSKSAIQPAARVNTDQSDVPTIDKTDEDTLAVNSDESPDGEKRMSIQEPEEEIYREGSKDIIEDEEGNVLEVRESRKGESKRERDRAVQRDARDFIMEKYVEHDIDKAFAGTKLAQDLKDAKAAQQSGGASKWGDVRKKMQSVGTMGGLTGLTGLKKKEEGPGAKKEPEKKHGPALAYQFGNTIIVEDQDGEVIKKYDIPSQSKPARPGLGGDRRSSFMDPGTRQRLHRVGTWMGMGARQGDAAEGEAGPSDAKKVPTDEDLDDERIRFTVTAGGRRMSKADFINTVSRLDPKSRQRMVDESDAPEALKREATSAAASSTSSLRGVGRPEVQRVSTAEGRAAGPGGLTLVDSNNEDIPFHPVSNTLANFSMGQETAAQRRRRRAAEGIQEEEHEDEDPLGEPRGRTRGDASASPSNRPTGRSGPSYLEERETAAERRRRIAALEGGGNDSSSDEEVSGLGFREPRARGEPRRPEQIRQRNDSERSSGPTIRFAEPTSPTGRESGNDGSGASNNGHSRAIGNMRLRWGADVGQKPSDGTSSPGGKKK